MSLLIKLKRTVYVIDGSEKKKNPKKRLSRKTSRASHALGKTSIPPIASCTSSRVNPIKWKAFCAADFIG